MDFNDVIGQKAIKQRLQQMISEDRVPHAIMLCGPAGSGKLALAIAFGCELLRKGAPQAAAASLFGEPEGPDPVGRGQRGDVHEDAACSHW